ncbi:unnamed protein product [Sympodiomycopsis kandeliae]
MQNQPKVVHIHQIECTKESPILYPVPPAEQGSDSRTSWAQLLTETDYDQGDWMDDDDRDGNSQEEKPFKHCDQEVDKKDGVLAKNEGAQEEDQPDVAENASGRDAPEAEEESKDFAIDQEGSDTNPDGYRKPLVSTFRALGLFASAATMNQRGCSHKSTPHTGQQGIRCQGPVEN